MPKTGTIEGSEETKPMEQNLARQARPRGYLAVAKPMAVGVANWLWYGGLIFLTVWAGLEIFSGVNYFRRALGVGVAVLILLQLLNFGR